MNASKLEAHAGHSGIASFIFVTFGLFFSYSEQVLGFLFGLDLLKAHRQNVVGPHCGHAYPKKYLLAFASKTNPMVSLKNK